MLKKILFVLAAAPVALAAQARTPGAARTDLPVDRVVAVVGAQAILWSDVMSNINQQRAQGLTLPEDSIGQEKLARQVLNDLVDEEILIQKAKELKVEVVDSELTPNVDRQIQSVRSQFKSDEEFRAELRKAGMGSPEDYRRTLMDQFRRRLIQQRVFGELQKKAKPRNVTEAEIDAAFEKNRAELQKRPATLTFRQIVVAPKASAPAKLTARSKADSLLAEIRRGGDFENIAKRESMDPGSKAVGGDLGWNRRGATVPEFERMMFALNPGQISPVFETAFGFHILRVDRVQAGEVKARHILIVPVIDSADLERGRLEADSVARKWRSGAAFDSLAAKHHDPAEERGILQPFPKDSLPLSYAQATKEKKAGDITDPFQLAGARGQVKYAVVQIASMTDVGQYDPKEIRTQIRAQLSAERATREMLDEMRKQTFVAIKYPD
ncbi:MAG: peptidylprolyl isomerase [Gemmatimonadaceae bacterium]|nr:peptidylprolyl isomerase [Gemmatimonadaceae bacterium]